MSNNKILFKLGRHLSNKHRGFIVASMAEIFALVYHIFALLFFRYHGIMQMFYFNIFSVACFSFCAVLLFGFKKVYTVFFLSTSEVLVHQILADYYLGALTGFHFLMLILVVFPYLVEEKNFYIGIPVSFISLLFFIGCEVFFSFTTPQYELHEMTIKMIRFINVSTSMIVVITMIVIFKLIIVYIESNLEELNDKNELLLENILPKKVVDDLRDRGSTEPENFSEVSILFTDIVNFTKLSKSLSPDLLINELNDIFTNFDRIIEKYNCVRIKTIGDAYMAVCGLPVEDANHTRNIVNAALECRDYLENRNRTSEHKWTIRLGVHTGNVVAGVVGIKKYIYDIFGDTVNVASRMETNSEEMKLCVSPAVYEKLKDEFSFTDRGKYDIKGKGPMNLYFVN